MRVFLLLLVLLPGWAYANPLQTTLDWLLQQVQAALPGQLSYQRLEAEWGQPVRIQQLRYQDGPLQVKVAEISLDLDIGALTEKSLHIRNLHLQGVELYLPPASPTPSSESTWPPAPIALNAEQLTLPIQLELDALSLQQVQIHSAPDTPPLVIERLEASARTHAQALAIDRLYLQLAGMDAQLNGQLRLDSALSVQLNYGARYHDAQLGWLQVNGALSGALQQQLQLQLQTLGVVQGTLQLQLSSPLDLARSQWQLQAQLQAEQLERRWPQWPAQAKASVELNSQGSLQDYQGQLTLNSDAPGKLQAGLQALALQLRFNGTAEQLQIEQLLAHLPPAVEQLQLQGQIQFAEPRMTLSGDWRALRWPLQGSAQVSSANGQWQFSGSADDYQAQLKAQLQGEQIPAGEWQIKLQGNTEQLKQFDLQAALLKGQLRSSGQLAWSPQPRWNLDWQLEQLNPGVQWPDYPGSLSLQAHTQGRVNPADLTSLELDLDLKSLSGELRQQRLAGTGQVQVRGFNADIQALKLQVGAAELQLAGKVAEQLALDWQLNLPDLSRLVAQASGRLNASGQVRGAQTQPNLTLKLQGERLAMAQQRLQTLNASAQINLQAGQASRLELNASGLELGGHTWQTLTLRGNGTPEAHQLSSELRGTLGQFALALNGGWQAPRWQGQLRQLELNSSMIGGRWGLAAATAISASAEQASVGELCLGNSPTRLCLNGTWSATQGAQGRVRLEKLNSSRLSALLPPTVQVNTQLDAQAEFKLNPQGQYQAQLQAQLAAGQLRVQQQGQWLDIVLNASQLTVRADPARVQAQVKLDAGTLLQVNGQLTLNEPQGAQRLEGRIQAQGQDFTLVDKLVPQLHATQGQLNADLRLGGRLSAPQLGGQLQLSGRSDVPSMNLQLRELQLHANANGERIELSGGVHSGQGQLALKGSLISKTGALQLQVQGQQFTVADTEQIKVRISPDLQLQANAQSLTLQGKVQVPYARLSPPPSQGPSAVARSEDVRIIRRTADAKTATAEPPRRMQIKVNLEVGDDVRAAAANLEAQIRGALLFEQSPELAPRASGSLELASGEYSVYGQKLTIERGRVLFSGGTLDNPGLDLRAIRTVDTVKVGVSVSGPLRQPKLKLFSEPNMPDASILSYLVLGRAPDASSGSESAMLLRAASALSSSGANQLTAPLQEVFALDELDFSGGKTVNETQVKVGKYLSPQLYVGYGVGLFDAVQTFNLRYKLSSWLTLESSTTGQVNSADLLYTFER